MVVRKDDNKRATKSGIVLPDSHEIPVITGRVIAVLLMIGGISMVGVVTAALASWIIQRVAEGETAIQSVTVAHIEELRSEIRVLAQQLKDRDERDAHA